ncbi:hypothetical protein HCH_04436 [Hahella chejuensis KCTC 2396]|uniref:Uncharacterized protein n=1 Tax=Hahella chejuensis (strain KCTC 2396) TaxID=349521 RepID=Q2SDY4_HAHCH|nr:hypothetical protein HCH_04436 [Hahella chejuensis KCTC 2396]
MTFPPVGPANSRWPRRLSGVCYVQGRLILKYNPNIDTCLDMAAGFVMNTIAQR